MDTHKHTQRRKGMWSKDVKEKGSWDPSFFLEAMLVKEMDLG